MKKTTIVQFVKSNWKWGILGLLFVVFIISRFYELEKVTPFGWDQVDNAFAAKNILVDHKYPLVGMVAKGYSGFNIGSAYYYFVAFFYWIFDLYPIAAGYIAGISAIITFIVLFFVIKKLFSFDVALIAVFINTVSAFITTGDRVQWPVNLIIPLSMLIFYFLYKFLIGEIKYIYALATTIGVSLHIHFTSIFYFMLVFLSLPFFPRTKKALYHSLLALPVFFIWLIPHVIYTFTRNNSQVSNLHTYINQYYHGVHLTRILQLRHDAFIEFSTILRFRIIDSINFWFPIVFIMQFYFEHKNRERLIFCYLLALWFLVPWLVFSTYRGEISNYYFFITRPMVLMILAYFTWRVFTIRNYFPKIAVIFFWTYFTVTNINNYPSASENSLLNKKNKALYLLENNIPIHLDAGNIEEFYFYYYFKEYKKGNYEKYK